MNAAGFKFSRYFGFGLMDASAMTKLARGWKTVPKADYCSVHLGPDLNDKVSGSSERSFKVDVSQCLGYVNFLEHVQLKVKLQYKAKPCI